MEICEPFGPTYPDLGASVAKLRRGADRKAHGLAVLTAINAKNRQAHQRVLRSHNVTCASGTNHNTGKAILKAVAQSHRINPDAIRAKRTPEQWRALYAQAMAEKLARETVKLAA
jgi:hypothetical protein